MKVSICMAVHNAEQFIISALSSIINQTFKDFEVIIVDDYSTDNTIPIIYNQFCLKDRRFKLYCNITDKNLKYIDAHNKSYSLAQGELLVRFDQDDIMKPNHIETIVSYMDDNQDVDGCCTMIQQVYDDNSGILKDYFEVEDNAKWQGLQKEAVSVDRCEKFNECPILEIHHNPASWFNQASCLRKTFFDRCKPKFKFIKNGDTLFCYEILSLGAKLKKIPQATLIYRIHDKSLCHSEYFVNYGVDCDWQIYIAECKVKAFSQYPEDMTVEEGNKIKDFIQVFNNTVEYFKNLKKENNE